MSIKAPAIGGGLPKLGEALIISSLLLEYFGKPVYPLVLGISFLYEPDSDKALKPTVLAPIK